MSEPDYWMSDTFGDVLSTAENFTYLYIHNKNVDIKFSARDALLE